MSYLGKCSKCGRSLYIAGTWGSPPVAIIHCLRCDKYEEHCTCPPVK